MSTSNSSKKFVNPLLQRTDNAPLPATGEGTTESFNRPTEVLPQMKKNPTFESNHARDTFWIERDLKRRFDELCRDEGKGSKTRFINEALSDFLRKHKIK